MAVLGLRFCARAFSSCGKWGPLFIAVRGPLTIAASPVAEHRLQTRRLSSCGSRAQLLRGMCDLPRPGLEPVSPALAGRFSTTVPPGKPPCPFLKLVVYLEQWFRNIAIHENPLQGLFKPRLQGPSPRVTDPVGLKENRRMCCISNNFLAYNDAYCSGHHGLRTTVDIRN